MDKISVFLEAPEGFNLGIVVGGCYCEFDNKILFLKRNTDKSLGEAWGIPGGKLKRGECPREAVIREVSEEVGLTIAKEELEELGTVYVRHYADVVLHIFRKRFLTCPTIRLNLKEHSEATWLVAEEALKLPHITGGVKALKFYKM